VSIEQQLEDAAADFQALILEGMDSRQAVVEAATSNGLKSEALENRLSRTMSIEALVEKVRKDADCGRFLAVTATEIENCRKRAEKYAQLGLLGLGAEEVIAKSVEASIGRSLTDHEVWKIGEMWNPWLSEMKLAHKAKVQPLRKLSIGD